MKNCFKKNIGLALAAKQARKAHRMLVFKFDIFRQFMYILIHDHKLLYGF
jgi:hypothetical protein